MVEGHSSELLERNQPQRQLTKDLVERGQYVTIRICNFGRQFKPCKAPVLLLGGRLRTSAAKVVKMVRNATREFIGANTAMAVNYMPFLGCVRLKAPWVCITSPEPWQTMEKSMWRIRKP